MFSSPVENFKYNRVIKIKFSFTRDNFEVQIYTDNNPSGQFLEVLLEKWKNILSIVFH